MSQASKFAKAIHERDELSGIRVHQGEITSVSGRKATVTVSGVSVSAVPAMDGVILKVGAACWVMNLGSGRWIVFGTTNGDLSVSKAGDTMTGALTVDVGSASTAITGSGSASVISTVGSLSLSPPSGGEVQLGGLQTIISSTSADNPLRIYTGSSLGPYISLFASDGTTRRGLVGLTGGSTMEMRNEVAGGITVVQSAGDLRLRAGATDRLTIESAGLVSIPFALALGTAPETFAYHLRIGLCTTAKPGIMATTDSTSARTICAWRNPNGTVGTIVATGTTTAYNTTSDARLKTEVEGESPLAVLNRLQPKWFKWDADEQVDYGFFAQEANEVWPNAVSPGGDDVVEDPWMIDQSKLVGLLVGAVQELTARVEALEAQLA